MAPRKKSKLRSEHMSMRPDLRKSFSLNANGFYMLFLSDVIRKVLTYRRPVELHLRIRFWVSEFLGARQKICLRVGAFRRFERRA